MSGTRAFRRRRGVVTCGSRRPRQQLPRAAVVLAIALLGAAAASAAGLPTPAGARSAGPVHRLPFSVACSAKTPTSGGAAPHVLGALAEVTIPASWHTTSVPPNTTSSGGGCEAPYLITDPRGNVGRLCLGVDVYATMAPAAGETPEAFLGRALPVLAHGRLPTVAGMRGVWAEVNVGVTPAYPSYAVEAAYEAANRRVFYELIVVPPMPVEGCPASTGPQGRGFARQLASSFRVLVTDPATAEAASWSRGPPAGLADAPADTPAQTENTTVRVPRPRRDRERRDPRLRATAPPLSPAPEPPRPSPCRRRRARSRPAAGRARRSRSAAAAARGRRRRGSGWRP